MSDPDHPEAGCDRSRRDGTMEGMHRHDLRTRNLVVLA